jgi:CRISPR-associated protein Cas1
MIRRTVEISRESYHLAVRDGQLLLLRREAPPRRPPARPENLAGSIPIEDLGVLVVDERDTTYTQSVLTRMAEAGAALVVCGADHLPCGMYLPLSSNTQLLGRLEAQLSAPKPRRKRLWSTIVAAKIRAQAGNLAHAPEVQRRLTAMAGRVRSGDPDNLEAQAARLYWPALFDALPAIAPPFRRRPGERGAPPPNNLLDYGYAVLRASLGRAIVAAGLLPALGVQHHGRSNPFSLADDLIEPLRPLVDARARDLAACGRLKLDPSTKPEFLRLLGETVRFGDETGPLDVVMARYVAGFVRVLTGEATTLATPAAASSTSRRTAREGEDPCT